MEISSLFFSQRLQRSRSTSHHFSKCELPLTSVSMSRFSINPILSLSDEALDDLQHPRFEPFYSASHPYYDSSTDEDSDHLQLARDATARASSGQSNRHLSTLDSLDEDEDSLHERQTGPRSDSRGGSQRSMGSGWGGGDSEPESDSSGSEVYRSMGSRWNRPSVRLLARAQWKRMTGGSGDIPEDYSNKSLVEQLQRFSDTKLAQIWTQHYGRRSAVEEVVATKRILQVSDKDIFINSQALAPRDVQLELAEILIDGAQSVKFAGAHSGLFQEWCLPAKQRRLGSFPFAHITSVTLENTGVRNYSFLSVQALTEITIRDQYSSHVRLIWPTERFHLRKLCLNLQDVDLMSEILEQASEHGQLDSLNQGILSLTSLTVGSRHTESHRNESWRQLYNTICKLLSKHAIKILELTLDNSEEGFGRHRNASLLRGSTPLSRKFAQASHFGGRQSYTGDQCTTPTFFQIFG
ncbi:hypothetical protein T439DRAFT_64139 [Meredithblackwellia eburnea MCA 4105]